MSTPSAMKATIGGCAGLTAAARASIRFKTASDGSRICGQLYFFRPFFWPVHQFDTGFAVRWIATLIDPLSIWRNLGERRARMVKLGITEDVVIEYCQSCGANGERKHEAFAALVARFSLKPDDAAFVGEALGNFGPS